MPGPVHDPAAEQRVDESRAEREITAALYRYCNGVDRVDRELIASAYHADAHDEHGVFDGPVTQFLDFAVTALRERVTASSHQLSNIEIEVDGTSAAVQSYVLATQVRDVDGRRIVEVLGGRYLDRFEQRGEWRIARRRLVVDWSYQVEAAAIVAHSAYHAGCRDRDDARYELFRITSAGQA
ncbi:hypothetical protein BJF78_07050 [Pseudonocardia sp. CNS-139]|nr:hypothetical protein BJF78_07050 [Pseudonocardia sp. CNS-139]